MENTFDDRQRGDYRLTADVTQLSVDTIHRWLATEAYWARGRSRDTVETSLRNSYVYGVLSASGETVACVRVVTDGATFAWITDAFVDAVVRGQGLGTWMVGEVTEHWLAAGVPRVVLGTADAHDVYAKVGFVPLAFPERFMEIDRRAKY
ncbi:MAG TPA: GNAT family N-acetyltransferase [Acidimicrobiales bacterium]